MVHPPNRFVSAIAILSIAWGILPVAAQGADGPWLAPAATDRNDGEEREIRQRIEWFAQRRGLDITTDARVQRARAVASLQQALSRQAPSLLAAQPWLPLGPDSMTMLDWRMGPVSGRVTALAMDPAAEDTLYLGSAAGGLWKSTDAGASWQPLTDALGTGSIGSLLLEPGTPGEIWVGTGEANAGCLDYFGMGLFHSADGGVTFEPRNGSAEAPLPLSFVTAIAQSPLDPQVLVVGGTGTCNENGVPIGGGIYRTTDGGASWSQALPSGGVSDLLFSIVQPEVAYAAVRSKGIYKSTDAGATWTRLENGLPTAWNATYSRLAMAASDNAVLYALVGNGSGGTLQLYRSSDAGASWSQVNANACEGQCWYNLTLDVHPDDPDRLLVGTIRPALSTNGGQTLSILTANWGGNQAVHQDTHVVRWSANGGDRLWVGGDGGLWRSDDGGSQFENLNGNLQITQFYDVALDPEDPERVYGGAQDNSSSVRDGSSLWSVTTVTGDGFMNAVDPRNPQRVFQSSYPSGGAALILSTSRGEPYSFNWVGRSGFDTSEPFPWVTPLVTGNDAVFVASNRVYRAPIGDNAAAYTWSGISPTLTWDGNATVSVLAVPATEGRTQVLYAGTSDGRIGMTANALAAAPAWVDRTGSWPRGNVSDIAFGDAAGYTVYGTRSVFQPPQLLRATGAGDWQAIGEGLPKVPANSVAVDPAEPTHVYVGTDIGVYRSTDGGETFEPWMAGMPLGMVVTDIEVAARQRVLVAATYGRGAWKLPLEEAALFRDGFDGGQP